MRIFKKIKEENMPIEKFNNYAPEIAETAFIHPTAVIIGNVKIEDEVSIWPLVVLRGDVDMIKIGRKSNVQDLCVFHPNKNKPVIIGQGVTVGHGAVVHGSVIGNNCLIAMNSTIIDSEIGDNCIIGANALVPPNSKIPPQSLVLGVPGKVIRKLTDDEIKTLKESADVYVRLSKEYKKCQ
jgi:carbonic anhydrase/acetyltransferase-like protein (isoleucine patch superfamily)